MNDNFQNNSTEQNYIANTALNVVLVIIETLLTLLLRFDAELRKVVYPLAMSNTVVCIHSYIPNVTFYVTFTVNGILLDSQLQPSQQVDVTINGFTWQIAQSLFTNKPKVVEQLQIRGEAQNIANVKSFLYQIGLNQILQVITNAIKGNKGKERPVKPIKSTDEYKQQIDVLNVQINSAEIQKAQLQTQILELQSKNKFIKRVVLVLLILLIVCAIGWAIK